MTGCNHTIKIHQSLSMCGAGGERNGGGNKRRSRRPGANDPPVVVLISCDRVGPLELVHALAPPCAPVILIERRLPSSPFRATSNRPVFFSPSAARRRALTPTQRLLLAQSPTP